MPSWNAVSKRVAAAVSIAVLAATGFQTLATSNAGAASINVTSVSPHDVAQGATRDMTVHGSGFDAGAVPTVGGSDVSVSHVHVQGSTIITMWVTAGGGATLGARSLTVTDDVGTVLSAGAIDVTADPELTAVSPAHVPRSGLAERLSLTGTNLRRGLRFYVTGANPRGVLATVTSSTHATVLETIPRGALLGVHAATLINADGGYGLDPSALTVDRLPSISSVTARSLNQDETITETVMGAGFEAGAVASAGPGLSATVGAVTSSQLDVTLHVGASATVGHRSLKITNPDGGVVVRQDYLHVDYAPIFTKWAVGDGATAWTTTLKRPTFATSPTLAFSGTGVSVASETLNGRGQVVVGFTVSAASPDTWRTMTITDGPATWTVPRALKIRVAPSITSFPSASQGTTARTLQVKGTNFEVCPSADPVVTVSGTGVTVNFASTAFGYLMYVNVTIAPTATLGARDVTMTNCDSGGTSTSVGVFTVTS